MSDNVMLTTWDNAFNPFRDFVRWWKEDIILGHDTCGTLARESNVSDIASDNVNEESIMDAMNRIVDSNPTIYRIVSEDDYLDTQGGGV